MAIDWSKVGESAILIGPTALVGAYVGARIKAHLDRARPLVSVSSCREAEGRDLLASRIAIPKELSERLRESPWGPTMSGDVNAAQVESGVRSVRKSIAEAREVLDFLDKKLKQLPSLEKASKEAKIAFLDEISRNEVAIIDACMTGSLARGELKLPLPADPDLEKMEQVTHYVDADEGGGYLIHLHTKWYHLCRAHKHDNPQLLPAVKAFTYCHVPSLAAILEHVRKDILQWAAAGDTLGNDLDALLKTGKHLVVDLSIVNRGRSAALFTQWGLLRLFGNEIDSVPEIRLTKTTPLWKPDDPVLAAQQEKILRSMDDPFEDDNRGFSVPGGETIRLAFRSVDPLSELVKRIPNIESILSMEVFLCQVGLKRADVERSSRRWILSSASRFGASGERFPAEDIPALKKRWARRFPWLFGKKGGAPA